MLTHEERKKRRESIANEISNGAGVDEVIKKYSISLATLKSSCQEHNVQVPRAEVKSVSVLTIYAAILHNTGKSIVALAKELGISRTRVYQVIEQAKKLELPMPKE